MPTINNIHLADPDYRFVEQYMTVTKEKTLEKALERLLKPPSQYGPKKTPTHIDNGHFINLLIDRIPYFADNELSIDLSELVHLIEIDISAHQVAEIILPQSGHLRTLRIPSAVTSIDLSKQTNLAYFRAIHGKLETLDTSQCPNLQQLICYTNKITTLDTTANPLLEILLATGNPFTSITLGEHPNLRELSLSKAPFDIVDVSRFPCLENLIIITSKLTQLIIPQGSPLYALNLKDNQLQTLDLRNAPNLAKVYVSDNQLQTLDVTGLSQLISLFVQNNRLSTLDLSSNISLQSLSVAGNPLQTLDIRANPFLRDLDTIDIPLQSTEKQRHFIKGLRKKYKLGSGSKAVTKMTPWELHDLASSINWDSRTARKKLKSIANQKQCDLATALLIYWLGKPHYLLQFRDRDHCLSEGASGSVDDWDLLMFIEERVLAGKYTNQQIPFNPRNDGGTDWTAITYDNYPKLREIPAIMFEPVGLDDYKHLLEQETGKSPQANVLT